MQTELIEELNKILKAFPKFWNGEELHRSMVSEAISRKQPDVIKALVANEKIKSVYGTDIDGIFIFDFDKLCNLLKYKEYWANSFTKYRNKVGITSEGKYLDYNFDVVLDFPFKDCVLEGGMTKEDQGKNETYYNEIIAKDEIDNLFSPKVLTRPKRYAKEGISKNITEFYNDDSFIIKGNNLIALRLLKARYAGKIKLIYIDPPYNTGSDGFQYNDKFNHSSWLAFMKNRLESALELLSDDGSIWINIDDNECHYLKVLSDSIFGRANFVANIIWNNNIQSKGYLDKISSHHNHLLVYRKTSSFKINPLPRSNEDNINYKNPDNDPNGKWRSCDVRNSLKRPNLMYNITTPSGHVIKHPENGWRFSKETFEDELRAKKIIFSEDGKRIIRKIYLKDQLGRPIESIWFSKDSGTTRIAKNEINTLFEQPLFSTPKPEKLIHRIIHISTKESDLVLDFHLGSGTTAAVAHKMGRRYIGIEQMDYINEITVPRLQKVIEGEQGGISKDVGWQGGGSFVYAELMELNAYFVCEIQKAQSAEELEKLFEVMKTEAHLNYQVALENVLSAEYEVGGIFRKVAFSELVLHEQKRLLIEILDKNQLYVNASDMDDADLNISESDKAFTRSFYGKE